MDLKGALMGKVAGLPGWAWALGGGGLLYVFISRRANPEKGGQDQADQGQQEGARPRPKRRRPKRRPPARRKQPIT